MARPLVVGWSYGGILAWHWADESRSRSGGSLRGRLPDRRDRREGALLIRKMFRRWRLLLPLAAWFGLSARMTADQHADVNIELNEIAAASVPVLDRLTCPVRFVMGTGDSLGAEEGVMEEGRAVLDSIVKRNENLTVSAKVSSSHTAILRKDSAAVAQAVRDLAATTWKVSAEP